MSEGRTSQRATFEAVEALVTLHAAVRQGGDPRQIRTQMANALAELHGDSEKDLRLALSAAADEFSQLPGSLCNWMNEPQAKLLQLEFCGTDIAGEKFFDTLEQLMHAAAAGNPRAKLTLEVYAVCLSLGFQGKYAGHDLEGIELLRQRVLGSIERAPLSVEPPTQAPEKQAHPSIPLRLVAGASVLFAVTLWITLYFLGVSEAELFADQIESISSAVGERE